MNFVNELASFYASARKPETSSASLEGLYTRLPTITNNYKKYQQSDASEFFDIILEILSKCEERLISSLKEAYLNDLKTLQKELKSAPSSISDLFSFHSVSQNLSLKCGFHQISFLRSICPRIGLAMAVPDGPTQKEIELQKVEDFGELLLLAKDEHADIKKEAQKGLQELKEKMVEKFVEGNIKIGHFKPTISKPADFGFSDNEIKNFWLPSPLETIRAKNVDVISKTGKIIKNNAQKGAETYTGTGEKPALDLTTLIHENFKEKHVNSQENFYSCPRCLANAQKSGIEEKPNMAALLRKYLYNPPESLMFSINRFSLGEDPEGGPEKVIIKDNRPVVIPLHIDLTNYVVKRNKKEDLKDGSTAGGRDETFKYSLNSLVCHAGSLSRGHFHCLTYHRQTGTWWMLNDRLYKRVEEGAIRQTQGVVMAGYTREYEKRQDLGQAPEVEKVGEEGLKGKGKEFDFGMLKDALDGLDLSSED